MKSEMLPIKCTQTGKEAKKRKSEEALSPKIQAAQAASFKFDFENSIFIVMCIMLKPCSHGNHHCLLLLKAEVK